MIHFVLYVGWMRRLLLGIVPKISKMTYLCLTFKFVMNISSLIKLIEHMA